MPASGLNVHALAMGAAASELCDGGGGGGGDTDPLQAALESLTGGDKHAAERGTRVLHARLKANGALAPQLVRQGAVQPLQKTAVDSNASTRARKDALLTLSRLALCYEGAMLVANPEFVSKTAKMTVNSGGVFARQGTHFALAVGTCLAAAAGDRTAAGALLHYGAGAPAVTLAGSSRRKVCRVGMQLLARLADNSRAAASTLAAEYGARSLAALLIFRLQTFAKAEDVDGQRAVCLALARIGQDEAFAEAVAELDGLAPLLVELHREVPVLRAAAGYTLAILGQHKRLRLELVKKRCLQAYVAMAEMTSQRQDFADCQRVASLGFINLCSTYHLRLAGAKAGVLDAIILLLNASAMDVRRGAAQACAQLALVEENSRRLCFGGALHPLFVMARSGDRISEHEAALALNALCVAPENHKHMVREGVVHVLLYLTSSEDPAARDVATKMLSRIRRERLRSAARMAVRMARVAQGLQLGARGNAEGGAPEPEEDLPPPE